jgi:predicted enzyme related to lactoylglutathione lyase
VVQERTDIPEIGMVFAVFQDTEGNLLNVVADLPR